MTAYLYRMPAGIPGDISRHGASFVEPAIMDPTTPLTAYGTPGVIDATSQNFRKMQPGDSALTEAWGFLVRPYPTNSQSGANAALGAGLPPTSGPVDVMRSGYMTVLLQSGTCKKGGQVYIWVAADSGAHKQGGIESASGGGSNTIALTDVYFEGAADANGNVEISVRV